MTTVLEGGAARAETTSLSPFLRRVRLRHFKSIAQCDVALRPLTVLVGRNGAGKSNFLDALHFVADSLDTSLDHAVKSRGGIDEVRRRSTGHPHNFSIELEINLPNYRSASYGFEIRAKKGGNFAVKAERLRLFTSGTETVEAYFDRAETEVRVSAETPPPPALEDRLYLVNVSGLPAFREVYDALLAMGFYNFNPEAMKELQSPHAGELLHRDGSNVASVIGRLTEERPPVVERIRSYLEGIIPGISSVERETLGPKETLVFRQAVKGSEHPWRFYASSMSDGTLRALGALVAVVQLAGADRRVRLIGIEEPETALHPAASGALMDALREASEDTQVLVTSHSPDLLDQLEPAAESLLVVASEGGISQIAQADAASREAIEEHLSTPGELLRLDLLQPDHEDVARQEQQFELFAQIA